MRCVTCDHRTKVVDSRPSNTSSSFKGQRWMRTLVSWYTQDWVCRRRKCPNCKKIFLTVEIPMEDLEKGWSPKD